MTRRRVLVVDDKETVLELVEAVLADSYDVTRTAEGREALDLIERCEYDVVISDVRMPSASGFEVLAAVKRRAWATSVVLMTGFASVQDAVRAMKLGAFDYVAKPVEAPELQLVVARAVEDRTHRTAGLVAAARPLDTDFHEAIVVARHRASREYLVALMRQFAGNVTRAATQARLTRESLHRLLKQYGVHSEQFKPPAG